MTTLELLILIGGLLHFGVLIASALVPQVLDWRGELARLSKLTRQLVWTHGAFIVLTIIGFGVLATANAAALAQGGALGRSMCGFIALFWLARLPLQYFAFDCRPYLTSALLTVGYHGLTVLFVYFVAVFGWAAVRPA